MGKLHWEKRQPPRIDQILGTNGAHRLPETFDLVNDRGVIQATLRQEVGGWRGTLAGSTLGTLLGPDRGKAKAIIREKVVGIFRAR